MTLDEAMEGQAITQDEALRELLAHGADLGEFLADMGESDHYDSMEVLVWLGY